MEIPWVTIINTLTFIGFAAPIALTIIYVVRRIAVQSSMCDAIACNNTSKVRAIMLTFGHFLKTSQRNNANMYLMSNGDPIKASTKELEEDNDRSSYCDY